MELVCLSALELSSFGTSEVVPEPSEGPEEGSQYENHCEHELLPKA